MDTRNQEILYDEIHQQLKLLGIKDACDLADRMKLELDYTRKCPHPVSLLKLAHTLLTQPLGGQDGFGDLMWQVSDAGQGSLQIEFEHDGERGEIKVPGHPTPSMIEQAFEGMENGIVIDYVDQQDDDDTRHLWEYLAHDCLEYESDLGDAEAILAHPKLQELFHDAVQTANDSAIADALELDVDPNASDELGNTAMHWAARYGHTHLIGPLAHAGADIERLNGRGQTPLHLAAQMMRPEACLALIALNADVSRLDNQGATPLALVQGGCRGLEIDL